MRPETSVYVHIDGREFVANHSKYETWHPSIELVL